jgi:hypothetical protein
MPLIKIVGIAIKTLSKPISTYVKGHLQDSPIFARIMTGFGRRYQRVTNFMTHTKSEPLTQDRAITLGSEIFIEALFFGVAGGLVLYDHTSSKKKSAKLEKRLQEIERKCNL